MKKVQKSIKYISLTVAFLLSVFMIDIFVQIVFSVAGSISGWDSETVDEKKEFTSHIIDSFQIDAGNCNVKLETGGMNGIQVYTNKKDITVQAIGRKILIKSKSWFSLNDSNARVRIVIPKDLVCHDVKIKVGMGQVSIGEVKIDRLDTNISVGQLKIEGGVTESANLLIGVGDAKIQGCYEEMLSAEVAIGEICVNEVGDLNQYTIHAESEIGNVELDYKTFESEDWKKGKIKMELECGLGDIQILSSGM